MGIERKNKSRLKSSTARLDFKTMYGFNLAVRHAADLNIDKQFKRHTVSQMANVFFQKFCTEDGQKAEHKKATERFERFRVKHTNIPQEPIH